MGITARDVVLCALVLFQLLCACHCYQAVRFHGGRKLELPKRALLTADNTNVLRAHLIHRDNLQTGPNGTTKSRSEKFLDAVKRSQSRVSQLQKTASLSSPVSANNGDYVMKISLGTPPKQFITVADTGSDLIWVQCSPCSTTCFQQPDPLFKPTNSRTYSPVLCNNALCKVLGSGDTCRSASSHVNCTYQYGYGDGSTTQGNLAYETVTLGRSGVPHVAFGCGNHNQGTFDNVDGLVGLGRGPLSLPSQLSSQASIAQIFSYCLVDAFSDSGTTSSPITFGNAAANSAVKYTPLVIPNIPNTNVAVSTFYYVGVTGISVGGKNVQIPASAFQINPSNGEGGVILDSGTTLTMWSTRAWNPIVAAFQNQIKYPTVNGYQYGLNLCYDISSVSNPSSVTFPGMVVQMSNATLETPGSTLFVQVDYTVVCLAMIPSDEFSIIGNIQQQNNIIVYDVVNKRVGFTAADCATLS